MPRRSVPLNDTVTVVLDGSGSGTAKVGPISAREVWRPAMAHVSVSTNTTEATCSVFVGDAAIAANLRDATFKGSSGNATARVNADIVKVGSYVWAQWTGGDPGATGTLNVTGTKEI
jgi:hypothetical protein